jgi:hypothetical protein
VITGTNVFSYADIPVSAPRSRPRPCARHRRLTTCAVGAFISSDAPYE